jgi:hypothetical protein
VRIATQLSLGVKKAWYCTTPDSVIGAFAVAIFKFNCGIPASGMLSYLLIPLLVTRGFK